MALTRYAVRAVRPWRGCASVAVVNANPRLAELDIKFVDPGRAPEFTAVDEAGAVLRCPLGRTRALARSVEAEQTDAARTAAPLNPAGGVSVRAVTSALPTFATSLLAGQRLALRARWPVDAALARFFGTRTHRRERLTVRPPRTQEP